MALTSVSISNGRGTAQAITSELNEAKQLIADLKNYLGQNDNYNKFVNGTEFGRAQNEKIQKIIGLFDQNLTNETTNLTTQLNYFFYRQEEINRKAAAEAAAAAKRDVAAHSTGPSVARPGDSSYRETLY